MMKRKMILGMIVGLCAMTIYGCGEKTAEGQNEAKESRKAEVVTVGKDMTEDDLEEEVGALTKTGEEEENVVGKQTTSLRKKQDNSVATAQKTTETATKQAQSQTTQKKTETGKQNQTAQMEETRNEATQKETTQTETGRQEQSSQKEEQPVVEQPAETKPETSENQPSSGNTGAQTTEKPAEAVKNPYGDKEYTIDLGNGATTTVVGHFETQMADEIFSLLNQYRAEQGVRALHEPSAALQKAANIRGYEISYKFEHYRPNGQRALVSFANTTGCSGENLAKGQRSAQEVMQDWKNSPAHNNNMLSESHRFVAISVFAVRTGGTDTNPRYCHCYVQFFGW